jgi:hypothetical protein
MVDNKSVQKVDGKVLLDKIAGHITDGTFKFENCYTASVGVRGSEIPMGDDYEFAQEEDRTFFKFQDMSNDAYLPVPNENSLLPKDTFPVYLKMDSNGKTVESICYDVGFRESVPVDLGIVSEEEIDMTPDRDFYDSKYLVVTKEDFSRFSKQIESVLDRYKTMTVENANKVETSKPSQRIKGDGSRPLPNGGAFDVEEIDEQYE